MTSAIRSTMKGKMIEHSQYHAYEYRKRYYDKCKPQNDIDIDIDINDDDDEKKTHPSTLFLVKCNSPRKVFV